MYSGNIYHFRTGGVLSHADIKTFNSYRQISYVVGVYAKEYAFIMKMVKEKLKDLVTASLDLLFPPSCSYCKEMTAWIQSGSAAG